MPVAGLGAWCANEVLTTAARIYLRLRFKGERCEEMLWPARRKQGVQFASPTVLQSVVTFRPQHVQAETGITASTPCAVLRAEG